MLEIEKVIEDKLRALDQEKNFIVETLQKEKVISDERLKQLIEFYRKMSPKKAAPVFEQLNKDLVVQLFANLPQKQIMAIMEAMSPEKSVELTEYYGRIRSGKEYDVLKEMNTALLTEFKNCKEAH
jgi:flagellar motility protein MotE (MotC chaperone)